MSNIAKVIQELEAEQQRIESALRVLRGLDSGSGSAPVRATSSASGAASKGRGARKISAEGRRRIAEAQKRRWAKVRAARQAKR